MRWEISNAGGNRYRKITEGFPPLVKTVLNDFCSQVYVENCFDKESKIEVENMVKQVLDVYRERIIKLDWMQDATKVEAVKKINSMTVKVGYPDQWPSYMDAVQSILRAEGKPD